MILPLDVLFSGHQDLLEEAVFILLNHIEILLYLFVIHDLQLQPDLCIDPLKLPIPQGLMDVDQELSFHTVLNRLAEDTSLSYNNEPGSWIIYLSHYYLCIITLWGDAWILLDTQHFRLLYAVDVYISVVFINITHI